MSNSCITAKMWLYKILCLSSLYISYSQVVYSQSSTQLCPHDQSTALLQFKQQFSLNRSASSTCFYSNPPPYSKMVYWKEGTDCCEWDGITCDAMTGHVIGLDLSCSWLFGSIDSNSSIFQLSRLQKLNLAYNDFNYSHISPSIVRFPSLTHLVLTSSHFSGQIPSQVSHLSKLVSLDLSSNNLLEAPSLAKLIGNLTVLQELSLDEVNINSVGPPSLMNLSSFLTILSLRSCGLNGDFPSNVFHLPKLQLLILGGNRNLTGNLPKFNESSPLETLDLSFTSFSGELPDSISQLRSLDALFLSGSNFSGSIPRSMGNLTQLSLLWAQYNRFNGKVPSSLSNLAKLISLDLSNNNLEGQISDKLSSLTQLTFLRLSNNSFTGQFPSSFANLTQLSFLDLSYNQLTGPIPSPMVRLQYLSFLNLQFNSLNGSIPPWLFTQPSLLYLFLAENHFTGHLSEYQNHSLQDLDLSSNMLEGPIPSSMFDLVNLTHLYLSSNNLSGTVELHKFAKLQNLASLDLSYNSLSLTSTKSLNYTFPKLETLGLSSCNMSEIPVFLKTCEKLYSLDLSDNKIGGRIPEWLWNIGEREISYLNLSNNFLEGFDQYTGIPPQKSPSFFHLNSNMLQGSLFIPSPSTIFYSVANNTLTGELPPLICNLSSLQILDLSSNNISGLIPPCLGNFSLYLSVLNLQNNSLHGTLPNTFASESMLRTLDMSHNQLEGLLPRSLANCTKLEILNIGHNLIYDTFPFWLETLPLLQVLILRFNRFHGIIDQSRESLAFSKLRIIDVSYNNFTGNLPSKFFESWESMMMVNEGTTQLSYMRANGTYYFDSLKVMNKGREMTLVRILTIFTAVDFSNNKFHGEIPISIGKLKALHILNFSSNGLTGHIPLSLGDLKELESLDISRNKLSGEIPQQLARLTFLSVFDVSRNNLTGPIPQGGQFGTFPNTSYEENSGLCGFPMSKDCWKVEVAQPPPLPSQKGRDRKFKFEGFGWEAVVLGYGFGAVIGMVIGSLILQRKEQWFMRTFGIRRRPKGKRSKKAR